MNSTSLSQTSDSVQPKPRVHILSQRNAQWYFGGQAISLTGLMLRAATLSLFLIALLGKQKAAPYIGIVWASNLLAGSFFGAMIGLFLDRVDKRRALQITAVIGIAQGLILAYITRNGIHSPEKLKMTIIWEIVTVTVIGCFPYALDSICRNAMVKDALVDRDDHSLGAIIFNSLYNFGLIIGNGLAGLLVGPIGFSNLFLINAASYIVLIFALEKMDFTHLEPIPIWNGMIKEVNGGLRYTFGNTGIRICIILSSVVTVFGFAYNIILPVINETMFGGGPKEFSYLASSAGFGSLGGSLFAIFYGSKRKKITVVGACLALGIAQILLAYTRNIHIGAALMFISGAGFMCSFLPLRGALMHLIEDRKRTSVVLGITFQFFFGGMMVSSFSSGYAAKHFGCPAVLQMCGIALIITAVITPFLPGIKKIG
jgi:MFS family permease